MDPFSATAGVVGLLDVAIRLIKYLKHLEKATSQIDQEIRDLLASLELVRTVTQSIETAFPAKLKASPDLGDKEQSHVNKLWQNARTVLDDCQTKLEKLEALIVEISGKENPGGPRKLDSFRRQLRKQSKDDDYSRLRRDLDNVLTTLHLLMQTIELSYQLETQTTSDQLSLTIRSLNSRIEDLEPYLKIPHGLRGAVDAAKAVVALAYKNQHFDLPQSVSSIFTGRELQLEKLRAAFFTPLSPGQSQTQKRFVVYGLGGSGKTEFCCKFAQECRKHFWGVFCIDASSAKRRKQTFSKLAKRYGGREPNEGAAKDWLANLELPWLLIIDNADDSQTSLETAFPEGERGYILITTRNPSHRVHGTVGSFEFSSLDPEPASHLLLKAACKPKPWDSSTQESALCIAQALGFLPLAVIYAGRAIMDGLCTLQDYLSYYKTSWQRIDQAHGDSDKSSDPYMSVYSAYEMMYLSLKQRGGEAAMDAFQLLNMFAFLNNEGIQLDMLIQAAVNPSLEMEEQRKDKLKARTTALKAQTWGAKLEGMVVAALTFFFPDRSPPVLPHVLRVSSGKEFDRFRLRKALKELSERSLIIHNSFNDNYSMHVIVHTWVRERPEMMLDQPQVVKDEHHLLPAELRTMQEEPRMMLRRAETKLEIPKMTRAIPEMRTGRQAVWCEAAATTLAQAILLPPLGDQAADEDFRRDLLPHVEHVRKHQADIQKRIMNNQKSGLRPIYSRRKILQLAKFSRIYAQCGLWDEAERLQLTVRDYIVGRVGMKHPRAIRIQLALSGTYWAQGRGHEAADLQLKVLETCRMSLGDDDQMTLKVMDALAVSNWMQGRYREALKLHESSIERMIRTLGPNHEDTLRAKDHLGRVHFKYFRWPEAKALHFAALEGMRKAKALGPNHLDTLSAMENLAMTNLLIGGGLLASAQALMEEVTRQRKEKLGKEHPFTLLANLNLARIKGARGYHDEAEIEIRSGLSVAERNLGVRHIGTLYGKARLGQLLLCRKRLTDAEEVLLEVVENHRHMATDRDGAHPDRLIAMFYLLHCYRLQSNFEDALSVCGEVIRGLNAIGGESHPFMKLLLETQKALNDPRDRGKSLSQEWAVL